MFLLFGFLLVTSCSDAKFGSNEIPGPGLRLGKEETVDMKGGSSDSDVTAEGKGPQDGGEPSKPDSGTTPPPNDSGTTPTTPPITAVVPVPPPAPVCVAEAPNTVVSADGTLEFTNRDFKPGVYGEPSATKGLDWPNGGTNARYGVAPATVDWRLCPKIGFVETGHSLTRTISFRSLDADGSVTLKVHRHRRVSESYGVGIWYHWGSNIAWKDNKSLFKFRDLKDYVLTCSYTKATDKWLCSYTESAPTAFDCKPYQSKNCTNFTLKK